MQAELKHDDRLLVIGDHDEKTEAQMVRCLDQEDGSIGVLSADGHLGYSAPIGANIAYRNHISPAAVGYDIGCGNMAVATNLHATGDFMQGLPGLMDRVYREVPFGIGRTDGRTVDHPIIDKIRHADFAPQRELAGRAAKQLGTVGAGNHYVDIFKDETDRVWIGVHFGSRGFGHKTASGFLSILQGGTFDDRGKEDGMEVPPLLIDVNSSLGWAYLHAMQLAGEYAYAGREVVVEQMLGILGAEVFGEPVHNHHNFAWREEHNDDDFWVIRKGATPAFPGQRGFVGATMGEPSVILHGVESPESALALYSTVHGAGRAMSRKAAAGKTRRRWACLNRDCDYVQRQGTHPPVEQELAYGKRARLCPVCGSSRVAKRWVQESEGRIDWAATVADLKVKGIELRGANAEEAPGAYKRLDEVLAAHGHTVEVEHTLYPLGVAMASGGQPDD